MNLTYREGSRSDLAGLKALGIVSYGQFKNDLSIRGAGFFTWDTIVSFSTADEGSESSNVKLVLHFNEWDDKEIYIQSLGIDTEELIQLILRYKGDTKLFYSGHK